MKKQVLNLRRMMLVAALVSTVSFSAVATPAMDKNGKNNKTGQQQSSNFQYVGTTAAGIVFNITYNNADAAKFELIIKNGYGETVFQQAFYNKNFDKKVVLVKEPGDAHLTFIIRTPENDYKQSFDITTITRTVQDVVVKNLK